MTRPVPKIVIIVILFIMGALVGPSASAQGIRVGVLLPLTGKLSHSGRMAKRSFLMAVDRINREGGINGSPLELIFGDTMGSPDKGRSVMEKLITQDNVRMIAGGISSTVVWSALKTAQKRKVPFLVTTASADKITEKGGAYLFRLTPPISEHQNALITFVREVARIKTVAAVYENSFFGQARMNEFERQCNRLKLNVVAKKAYEIGQADFENLLSGIHAVEPELFCVISSPAGNDGARIVRQAGAMYIHPRLCVGEGAVFTSPAFREQAQWFSDYVFATTLWSPSVKYPDAQDYAVEYGKKYDETPDYHGAQAYAAVQVIADAMKRARSTEPGDIRDALAQTDMMTVFGPVKFVSYAKKSRQNSPPTFLGQWINGSFQAVWPRDLTTAEYVYPMPRVFPGFE